jgi:hypothetical protein
MASSLSVTTPLAKSNTVAKDWPMALAADGVVVGELEAGGIVTGKVVEACGTDPGAEDGVVTDVVRVLVGVEGVDPGDFEPPRATADASAAVPATHAATARTSSSLRLRGTRALMSCLGGAMRLGTGSSRTRGAGVRGDGARGEAVAGDGVGVPGVGPVSS